MDAVENKEYDSLWRRAHLDTVEAKEFDTMLKCVEEKEVDPLERSANFRVESI